MVVFAFWISENKNSVLVSLLAVTAAAKERVNAEKISSIKVIVASESTIDFECKVLYQLLVLMVYRDI